MMTDYESVFEATRDDDLFYSSEGAGTVATDSDMGNLTVLPPIHTDPPITGQARALSVKHLSPGAALRMEPEIRGIATELIDTFIERGEADITKELTTPLPARVILRLLNWDETRWPEWVTNIHTILHGTEGGGDPKAVFAWIRESITTEMRRRAESNQPADDLVGSILAGTIDGRELTSQEKFGYLLLLLFGGMDTTSGLTGNTLVEMSRQPRLRQQLIDNPELLDSATEEFLRVATPTQGLGRKVSRDAEFHGQPLKKGDRVLLAWAAANRDPNMFDSPGEVRLDRHPNRHMAFGVGQHRCLGSNIARTMFKVMITEILRRMPDFTVIGDPVRYTDAINIYAPRSLRIRFTPGTRHGDRHGTC
jgi:cytochrome P450